MVISCNSAAELNSYCVYLLRQYSGPLCPLLCGMLKVQLCAFNSFRCLYILLIQLEHFESSLNNIVSFHSISKGNVALFWCSLSVSIESTPDKRRLSKK